MDTLAEFYPAAKLWVSGILPRLDKDHTRGRDINQEVRRQCESFQDPDTVQFIDFSIDFVDNSNIKRKLYRYSEGHEDDRVHLGAEGNKMLASLFQVLLEHSLDERKGVTVDANLLSDQEEFDQWRIDTYGELEPPKRFVVTNWGLAEDCRQSKSTNVDTRGKGNTEGKERNTIGKQNKNKVKKEKRKSKPSGYNTGGYNNGSEGATNKGSAVSEGYNNGEDHDFDDSFEEEVTPSSDIRRWDVEEFSDEYETQSDEFVITDTTTPLQSAKQTTMPSRVAAAKPAVGSSTGPVTLLPQRQPRTGTAALMPSRLRPLT